MKNLIGNRVRVVYGVDSVLFGHLQGVMQDGDVMVWDEATNRRLFVGPVLEVSDARYTCDRCMLFCNRVFTHPDRDGAWCADCARPFAQAHQPEPKCERCGRPGKAVRNPKREAGVDTRLMCRSCHAEVGSNFSVPASVSRHSEPHRDARPRETCTAANVPGTVQCEGQVRPRGGVLLCNAHAGKRRTGERR